MAHIKSAVRRAVAGTAVSLCLCGCATSQETPIRRPQRNFEPQPLRVGVLPPRIHSDLKPENLQAEQPLLFQLVDGRGVVISSAHASRDIALRIVSTLSQAGAYERIFVVEDREDAQRLGADSLLAVKVQDYRTVLLGANRTGFWSMLTSPLMSQYWLRWRTIEARFDWTAQLIAMDDGRTLYQKHLQRNYTSPVRSASGERFPLKMLSFLQDRAMPDFIGELFSLEMKTPADLERPPALKKKVGSVRTTIP